ncbi:MAG: YebC/PmpR family DNA-binding transcriptional regulator [Flavobacteriales bacterium]|nr:YebC/PmpR family DNA-binding transcriptional regulator [Flavobacteriales bacterium]|tara:strand:- start:266 stop:1015 length:750 start_codon:yes stop_codon:yes gene_type:complete
MGRAFEFRKERKMKRWSAMSKTFSRIGKEISISVKKGGDDPETNIRLRQAIQNAKEANMPKENILRAIKKASGSSAENYMEISLEGYASSGVAIFVDCATDNNNRTVANVRSYFTKYGGSLGTNGSLEFIFERMAVFKVLYSNIKYDIEEFEMRLIDGGLEYMQKEEDCLSIFCKFKEYSNMQNCLDSNQVMVEKSEIIRVPNNTKNITVEESKLVLKLLDHLNLDDDVQGVFHNMEYTKEILEIIEEN